jgi:hypothetical protein
MPDRIIGRRDSSEDEWHWGPARLTGPRRPGGPRRSRQGLLLAAGGGALICVGIVLLILSADSSGSESSATNSPAPSAAAALGATGSPNQPAASTPPAPSQSPPPIGDVTLYVWSRQDKRWLDSDNSRDQPGYRDGEAIPFMLRIEDTVPGVYEVALAYECRTGEGVAVDYLANLSEGDSASLATSPAPPRREDSSIPVPDDPSITFDGAGRRFRVWGGSFQQMPSGPSPTVSCQADKGVGLSLLAQGGTLFLIWGAHLAQGSDWGENQGASNQRSPIHVEASVNQAEAKRIAVGPDAIAP